MLPWFHKEVWRGAGGSGRGPTRSARSQEKPTMRAPWGPPRAAAGGSSLSQLAAEIVCWGCLLFFYFFWCLSGLGILVLVRALVPDRWEVWFWRRFSPLTRLSGLPLPYLSLFFFLLGLSLVCFPSTGVLSILFDTVSLYQDAGHCIVQRASNRQGFPQLLVHFVTALFIFPAATCL